MRYINVIVFFLLLAPLHAREYYVAPDGSADFIHIQDAANVAQAGDSVYIKAGRYKERIFLTHSGTATQNIIFTQFQNDKVIIDGKDINWSDSWGGLVDISNVSYIKLSGIEVVNSNHAGVFLDTANHIEIDNIKTNNTFSSGIGVWSSHYVIIKNSEVALACNDGGEECISIADSSSYVTVANNEVHHNGAGTNGGEGIDVKQGSHDVLVVHNHVHHLNNRIGLYADAWDEHTYNIRFDANLVHDCTNMGMVVGSEMGGVIEYVSFINNIVYHNNDGGMTVAGWGVDGDNTLTHPVKNIAIINNTFYANSDGIYIANRDAKDIKIYNNIVAQNDDTQIYIQYTPLLEVEIRANLIDGKTEAYGQYDEVVGAAGFKDAKKFDFHLTPQSKALNRGVANSYAYKDYGGTTRPKDGAWDIGAYEFNALEAFVQRLYKKILLRQADKEGLVYWVDALEGFSKSGANIAKGFIFSSEFTQRELDDTAYIKVLYRAFFDREADDEGLSYWLSLLSQAKDNRQARADVLDGFLYSDEFRLLAKRYSILANATPVELFVGRFYKQILERTPDEEGLAYWSSRLELGEVSAKEVAFGFVFSDEFIEKYLDNATFLTRLYSAFFAREPDQEGLRYWEDALDKGVSKQEVLNGFLGSQEFKALARLHHIRVL